MGEGDWHERVRDRIRKYLDAKSIDYKFSHGTNKVPLFLDKKEISRSTQLSDADFIIYKNGIIKYIIEIETGAPTPKKIIGIICATNLSKIYRINEDELKIKNAKLFIITEDKETNKPGSKKSEQYENIQKHLQVNASLCKFQIVTEKEVTDVLTEIEREIKSAA